MSLKKKILVGFLGFFVVLGIIGAFMPEKEIKDEPTQESTQQNAEANQNTAENLEEKNINEEIAPIEDQKIKTQGFVNFKEPTENGSTYATSTNDGDYSVTYSSLDFLEPHKERFPVDREKIDINSIKVDIGYNQSDEFYKPYETIAFDFKINSLNYSGEITNLNAKSDKNGLIQTLTDFVYEVSKE